jgi:hypothetical protein
MPINYKGWFKREDGTGYFVAYLTRDGRRLQSGMDFDVSSGSKIVIAKKFSA